MHITVLCIGKMKKNSPEADIIARYIKSCKWPVEIIELDEKRALPAFQMKHAESNLLLKHLQKDMKVVVLDEHGKEFSSLGFSKQLSDWQDAGVAKVAFLIGGADGHTDELKKRANLLLSFGKITLPHMLARVVLTEQIFRARCIMDGHPYHRE